VIFVKGVYLFEDLGRTQVTTWTISALNLNIFFFVKNILLSLKQKLSCHVGINFYSRRPFLIIQERQKS
jgi:hypothetical protein